MSGHYANRVLPEPLILMIDGAPDYTLRVTRIGCTEDGEPVAKLSLLNGRTLHTDSVRLDDGRERERFIWRAKKRQPDLGRIQVAIENAMVDLGGQVPELLAALPTESKEASEEEAFIRFSRFIRKGFAQDNPPDMPLEALPEPVRTFVDEVAKAKEVPRGQVLIPLVAGLSAAIGRRARLIVGDDWIERAIFWFVVVGEPGDGKSPAQKAALSPLTTMHGRRMRAWQEAKKRYDLDIEVWNQTPRRDRVGERPVEPLPRHFYTTDSTMEKLAELAQRNPGVLLLKDEIASLVRALDMYRSGKGDDREKYLSLYNGDTMQVDRMGRTLYVEDPHVSLVGGVQPAKLPLLAGEAQQDGFVDRFAWFWVDGKKRPVEDLPVHEDVRLAMARVFYALCDYDPEAPVDWTLFNPNTPEPPADYVKFDREAMALWRLWRQANETLRWQHTGPLKTAYVKFTYLACRLALVLHCVHYPYQGRTGTAILVTRDTLIGALRLTECFRCHANRVLGHFDYLGTLQNTPEERVYEAVCQMGGEPVSTTELQTRFQRNIPSLGRILLKLKEQGRIGFRVERDGRPGRDPHYWFAVNPHERNERNEQIPVCLDVDALLRRLDRPDADEWEDF